MYLVNSWGMQQGQDCQRIHDEDSEKEKQREGESETRIKAGESKKEREGKVSPSYSSSPHLSGG